MLGWPGLANAHTQLCTESVSRAVPLPFQRSRRKRSGTASTCVPVVCDVRNDGASTADCVASCMALSRMAGQVFALSPHVDQEGKGIGQQLW